VYRFHVCLPEPMFTALQHQADALGLTKSEVLRRALDEYLAHRGPHGRLTETAPPRRRRAPQESPDGA
jgi:hypothetical protein